MIGRAMAMLLALAGWAALGGWAGTAAGQGGEFAGEYLRLADRLDRPADGYCLDIPGAGDWVQLRRPLVVHNCKGPARYPDELAEWTTGGKLRFPAYNLCVTAQGVFRRALPGSALLLHPCDDPYEHELQLFLRRSDGKMALANSGLCWQVGAHSERTWEKTHRWRTLSLQPCEAAPPALSAWEELPPP